MFRLAYTKPGYAESLVEEVSHGRLKVSFDEIEDIKIKRQLTSGMENDLAFLVRGQVLIMMEAQTYSINDIPLRMLFYVADILRERYWNAAESKPVKLPAVHLYVVYTGDKTGEVSLRDMMCKSLLGLPADIDLTVHVISEKSASTAALKQYFKFCDIVNWCRQNIETENASEFREQFREAVAHICVQQNVFADIIRTHLSEFKEVVYTMSELELAKKYERDIGRQEGMRVGIEKGREEGREEGIAVGTLKTAYALYGKLLKAGVAPAELEKAISDIGVSASDLVKIKDAYKNHQGDTVPGINLK